MQWIYHTQVLKPRAQDRNQNLKIHDRGEDIMYDIQFITAYFVL